MRRTKGTLLEVQISEGTVWLTYAGQPVYLVGSLPEWAQVDRLAEEVALKQALAWAKNQGWRVRQARRGRGIYVYVD